MIQHLMHRIQNPAAGLVIAILLLSGFTVTSYLPVFDNLFVLYDDPGYVTDNDAVLAGLTPESIRWAFSTGHEGNWHPLTWLSHMLDVTLFGLEPRGHHLTSLLLHLANTILLFTLLRTITTSYWKSLTVALIFALHPLHVESVAWIAERKDVLSTFFLFLTLHSYYRFTVCSRLSRYILTLFLAGCGLMAKPMLVTLPLLFLLLDWWPLNRFAAVTLKRLLLEKLPFFVIATGVAALTIITHYRIETVAPLDALAMVNNSGKALVAAAAYIKKMFLPWDLAVFYPYDPEFPPATTFILSFLFCVAMTALSLLWRLRLPFFAAGWAWYLVTLLPVSGIIRIGNMSMADRYTYVPLIGPSIVAVWGAAAMMEKSVRLRSSVSLITCALLMVLGTLTFHQTRHWFNGITLFSHASTVVENNWFAYYNLGAAYLLQADTGSRLNIADSLRKPVPATYRTLSGTSSADPLENAIKAFTEAVRIWPEYESAHYYLCFAYLKLGNRQAALSAYQVLGTLNKIRAAELEQILFK